MAYTYVIIQTNHHTYTQFIPKYPQKSQEVSPRGLRAIFERFRGKHQKKKKKRHSGLYLAYMGAWMCIRIFFNIYINIHTHHRTQLIPSHPPTQTPTTPGILHEGRIDKRVQYTIEGLFAVRKSGFVDFPAVPEALDLVEKVSTFDFILIDYV